MKKLKGGPFLEFLGPDGVVGGIAQEIERIGLKRNRTSGYTSPDLAREHCGVDGQCDPERPPPRWAVQRLARCFVRRSPSGSQPCSAGSGFYCSASRSWRCPCFIYRSAREKANTIKRLSAMQTAYAAIQASGPISPPRDPAPRNRGGTRCHLARRSLRPARRHRLQRWPLLMEREQRIDATTTLHQVRCAADHER
jgi:hypothetical protein